MSTPEPTLADIECACEIMQKVIAHGVDSLRQNTEIIARHVARQVAIAREQTLAVPVSGPLGVGAAHIGIGDGHPISSAIGARGFCRTGDKSEAVISHDASARPALESLRKPGAIG